MSGHFFNFSDREIMTPQVKEVNGMFYRIHPVVDLGHQTSAATEKPAADTSTNLDLLEEFSSEEQDVLYRRVRKAPGSETFRLVLDQESIPPALIPMVIGKGGLGRKQIEDETKARILFPEKGGNQQQNKPIEIISYDEVQLIICRRRLLQAAQTARFKIPFTHFLCFPVPSPAIHESFERFRNEVLKKCGGSRGFSPDLFQKPAKLHMTIGTLALFSPSEYRLAGDGLAECLAEGLWRELEGGPLVCRLKGLEIMNDDPSEVDVLYAKIVESSGRLQNLADRVYEWFMEAEPRFLQDKFDHVENVKLHVTLLNSRFRKGEEVGEEDVELKTLNGSDKTASKRTFDASDKLTGGDKTPSKRTFDASQILKNFSDFDFGDFFVKEIHISQRFSSDTNGFFKATKKVVFDSEFFRLQTAPLLRHFEEPIFDTYSDEPVCGQEDVVDDR